jgi:hypothetical protein
VCRSPGLKRVSLTLASAREQAPAPPSVPLLPRTTRERTVRARADDRNRGRKRAQTGGHGRTSLDRPERGRANPSPTGTPIRACAPCERTTGRRRRPTAQSGPPRYRRPPEAAWSSSTSRRRPVEPARRPDRLAHRVAGARRRVARRPPTACIASPRRYPCAEGPCQAMEVGARRSAPRGRTRWIIAPQDASRRAPGAVPRAQRARGRRACAALLGDCAEDAVPPSLSGVAARAPLFAQVAVTDRTLAPFHGHNW